MTWLHSYLYRREQFVVVNGKESVYVISGVPQGSVLGPRTTLLNDITHIHLSEGTRLCLYADDILLYKDIVTNDDVLDLQNNIDKIQLWSVENAMKFNETKCKYNI